MADTNNSKLKEALGKLSKDNDNHWTEKGQPRIETVRMLSGNPTLTREEIDQAFPGFSRTNMISEQEVHAVNLETAQKDGDTFVHLGVDAAGRPTDVVATGTQTPPPVPAPLVHAFTPAAAPATGAGAGENGTGELQDKLAQQEQLNDQIKGMQDRIEEAGQRKLEIEKEILLAQAEIDKLILERDALDEKIDPMEAYKRSVIKQNEESIRNRQNLGPLANLLASQMGGRSPIDTQISADNVKASRSAGQRPAGGTK